MSSSSPRGQGGRGYRAAAAAKSLQSCPTLCDPVDGSPPGFPVPGILQARILEWVAISFSNACLHAKLLQLCPTLCDPMDSSPPGSSVHGIVQARVPKWVAISFFSEGIFKKLLPLSRRTKGGRYFYSFFYTLLSCFSVFAMYMHYFYF